jgi:hypothetical protein
LQTTEGINWTGQKSMAELFLRVHFLCAFPGNFLLR